MSEREEPQEPWLERVREQYEATPAPEDDAKERLLAKLRSEPEPPRVMLSRLAPWLRSGSRALVWATAAVFLVVVGAALWLTRSRLERNDLGTAAVSSDSTAVVRFVLSAPGASRVSLVGDFNGWDAAATPMRRVSSGDWSISLPVSHGRHVYAFVVDRREWVNDPDAPLTAEDGFGKPNSVIVVGGPGGT